MLKPNKIFKRSSLPHLLDTINVIVSSTAVVQYKTGITMDYRRRRNQYRAPNSLYFHFVMLEADLSAEAALDLEELVWNEINSSDGRSALARKKWGPAYDVSTPSLGGQKKGADTAYCFYLVWTSNHD